MLKGLRAVLTGAAIGLATAAALLGTAVYAFTPDLSMADSGPRFIRIEHSWVGHPPSVHIESSLRVGYGYTGYRGETEIRLGVLGPGQPTARRKAEIDGALLRQLEAVVRGVRLRRLPYRPTYGRTDDYPRSLLMLPTKGGGARFEMLSQDRAEWLVLVSRDAAYRMYSTRSESLAKVFQQVLDAVSQPELDRLRNEYESGYGRRLVHHPDGLPEALLRLTPDPDAAIGTAVLDERRYNVLTVYFPDGTWSRRHEKRFLPTPDSFVVPLMGPVSWPAVFHVGDQRLWVWTEGRWGYLERRSAGFVRFGEGGDEAFNVKWAKATELARKDQVMPAQMECTTSGSLCQTLSR